MLTAMKKNQKCRWQVVCADGAVWQADLSRAEAELEKVTAQSQCTWCRGPHRLELDQEAAPEPPEAS